MSRLLLACGALVSIVACSNAASGTGSDTAQTKSISSLAFSNVTLELLAYGQSNNVFSVAKQKSLMKTKALSSASTSPATSYFALFQFDLGTSTSAILGFNVYRSPDGSNFTQIGTENYGNPTSTYGLGSAFQYYDYDATLALGTTYYYKVQAFDSLGNLSSMSPVASATFQAPFTLSLISPSSGTTVTSSTPTFTFSISNTALWSSTLSDYFNFSLYIKDKTGLPCYYGEFRYNFSMGIWQAPGAYSSSTGVASWTPASPISLGGITYSSGSISVDLSNSSVKNNNDRYRNAYTVDTGGALGTFPFVQGTTYEWDVFGDWWGGSYDDLGASDAMDSAYFVKTTSSSSGTGYGVSYANTYLNGEGSLNGSFSFSY
jgi:hypothetical protein